MTDKVPQFKLHDALQNVYWSIEEIAQSLKKQSLIFPVSKDWMIEERNGAMT